MVDTLVLSCFLGTFSYKLITDGQFFSTLLTSALEHISTILGLHALTKAMCLGTFALFGLIRSFWHILDEKDDPFIHCNGIEIRCSIRIL